MLPRVRSPCRTGRKTGAFSPVHTPKRLPVKISVTTVRTGAALLHRWCLARWVARKIHYDPDPVLGGARFTPPRSSRAHWSARHLTIAKTLRRPVALILLPVRSLTLVAIRAGWGSSVTRSTDYYRCSTTDLPAVPLRDSRAIRGPTAHYRDDPLRCVACVTSGGRTFCTVARTRIRATVLRQVMPLATRRYWMEQPYASDRW